MSVLLLAALALAAALPASTIAPSPTKGPASLIKPSSSQPVKRQLSPSNNSSSTKPRPSSPPKAAPPPPPLQALIGPYGVFDRTREPGPPIANVLGNGITVDSGQFLKNIQTKLKHDNDDYSEKQRSLRRNTAVKYRRGGGELPGERPALPAPRPADRPAPAALLPLPNDDSYLEPVQPTPRSRSRGLYTTRKLQRQRPQLFETLPHTSPPATPSEPSLPQPPPPPGPEPAQPPLDVERARPAPPYDPQTLTTPKRSTQRQDKHEKRQKKLMKLAKFIKHNKGMLKQLLEARKEREEHNPRPAPNRGPQQGWKGSGARHRPLSYPIMRVKENLGGEQLDMAHARGVQIDNMRLKGRVCQRSVMNVEGPKYRSGGRVSRPRVPPRGARPFSRTRAPRLVLPACCNCCAKSALGCA